MVIRLKDFNQSATFWIGKGLILPDVGINIVAVVCYYSTLKTLPAGLHGHVEWGLILALIMVTQVRLFTLD